MSVEIVAVKQSDAERRDDGQRKKKVKLTFESKVKLGIWGQLLLNFTFSAFSGSPTFT